MKLERGPVPIDFARELVEEALVVASRGADAELRAAFLEEREAVHSIETVDIREKHLDALDSQWMDRLRVAEALESVLARHQGLEDVVSRCFLKLARAKEDEKAYLYSDNASPPGIDATGTATKPALVIQLTVDTLLASDKLEPLLMTTLARARRSS
ncbi:MAG: hypothetical protein BMS9Abin37_2452 [Acidobacteriota bacterium]|nr:MAG: hypothetical protein BMS9Abin37_2452 [Acidobacteriota bacterium]